MDAQLRVQDDVAQRMKRLRARHGALDLQTVQARAVFDDGVLTALRPDEKNRAKALIEDFMIAANGVTARYLDRKGFPSFRRVLRAPERWARIVELAAGLGERLPADPSAVALDAFLVKRRRIDPARFLIGRDGTVKVWDTQTGEKLLAFDAGGAALSLDGRQLVGYTAPRPIQAGQARGGAGGPVIRTLTARQGGSRCCAGCVGGPLPEGHRLARGG